MAARGRIYRRGIIYYIAYRWDGREYRESARSTDIGVATRLLAARVAERRGHGHSGARGMRSLGDRGALISSIVANACRQR